MDKRIITLLVVMGLGLLVVNFTSAQGISELNEKPIISADSNFHFLQRGFEWVQLNVFTRSPESKVQLRLKLAERRLAEIKELEEMGRLKESVAEKLQQRYRDLIDGAAQGIERLSNQRKDVSELTELIQESLGRHQQVLQELMDKVPEQSKEAIQKALENSQTGEMRVLEILNLRGEDQRPGPATSTSEQTRLQTSPSQVPSSQTQIEEPSIEQPPSLPTPPRIPEAPREMTIRLNADGFNPVNIQVKVGTTVNFINDGSRSFWPASGVHPIHRLCPGFDSLKGLRQGESYSFTFNEVKTCPMHDHLSPSVRGSIIVIE